MNVFGSRLEKASSLVAQLRELECADHLEPADVHLIVAQDGTAQWSANIPCCQGFRDAVQRTLELHNDVLQNRKRVVHVRRQSGAIPDMELVSAAAAVAGEVYCSAHEQHVSLKNFVQGSALISGCCGAALDEAEQRLLHLQ